MLRPSFAELLFACSPVRLFGYWLLAIGKRYNATGYGKDGRRSANSRPCRMPFSLPGCQ
jgi:hypothetical protein